MHNISNVVKKGVTHLWHSQKMSNFLNPPYPPPPPLIRKNEPKIYCLGKIWSQNTWQTSRPPFRVDVINIRSQSIYFPVSVFMLKQAVLVIICVSFCSWNLNSCLECTSFFRNWNEIWHNCNNFYWEKVYSKPISEAEWISLLSKSRT